MRPDVQLGAASPYVYIMEYFDMDENIFNFGVLLQNPVRAVNGKISQPDGAGHGIRPCPVAVSVAKDRAVCVNEKAP